MLRIPRANVGPGPTGMARGTRDHADVRIGLQPTAALGCHMRNSVALGGCTSASHSTAETTPLSALTPRASNTASSPSALPCEGQDLDARYVGGGDGGQTFMGGIVIWNTGARRCALSGSVGFAAQSPVGVSDVQAVTNGSQAPVSALFNAAMVPYRDTAADLGNYLYAQLAAPKFNSTATCAAHIAPSIFVLTIGKLIFQVTNSDPSAPQNKILSGCDGRILLESIDERTASR
jgi:hypothetical protein